MPRQSDIERLRAAYENWGQGRYDRNDVFDPDTEFVISGPEPRAYSGREGVSSSQPRRLRARLPARRAALANALLADHAAVGTRHRTEHDRLRAMPAEERLRAVADAGDHHALALVGALDPGLRDVPR